VRARSPNSSPPRPALKCLVSTHESAPGSSGGRVPSGSSVTAPWRRLDPRRSVASRLLVGLLLAFCIPGGAFVFLLEQRLSELEKDSGRQLAGLRVADALRRLQEDARYRAEWMDRRARLVEDTAVAIADSTRAALARALPPVGRSPGRIPPPARFTIVGRPAGGDGLDGRPRRARQGSRARRRRRGRAAPHRRVGRTEHSFGGSLDHFRRGRPRDGGDDPSRHPARVPGSGLGGAPGFRARALPRALERLAGEGVLRRFVARRGLPARLRPRSVQPLDLSRGLLSGGAGARRDPGETRGGAAVLP